MSATVQPQLRPKNRTPAAPRIGIRDGRFVNTGTGSVFYPRGFNYIRLEETGIWHNTLNEESYEPARAAALFADLTADGFNVVRVFIPEDTLDDPASPDHIRDAAFANLIDFLQQARQHGIYVILSLLHCPASMIPGPFAGQQDPDFVFDATRLQAKARYHQRVIRRIRSCDPDLLSAVFAYEHGNELCFCADRAPFVQEMDPADEKAMRAASATLQQLADRATLHYASVLNTAIKEEDPEALFSINLFTFAAVGRSGPGSLYTDRTPDVRFPARALTLAGSAIDYLDIHLYPSGFAALERDLQSIEWEQTRRLLEENGKPALIGETGVFREWQPDPQAAAAQMQQLLPEMLRAGFQGFLYWTYDCDEQSQQLWHAIDKKNPAILNRLAQIRTKSGSNPVVPD